nr:HlyD family efflux transporter periplasmic adaptor subunit [Gemmatimonadota bacterium]
EMRRDALRAQLAELERRRGALVLRAPVAGRLVTPRPEELVGTRVAAGDSLLELWIEGPLRARVRLDERDGGRVASGSPVGMKFPVRPEWTWRSHVLQVSPAARERQVELLAPLTGGTSAAEPELLRPGMVGEAKVVVRATHVAGALADKLLHTLRMDWLL